MPGRRGACIDTILSGKVVKAGMSLSVSVQNTFILPYVASWLEQRLLLKILKILCRGKLDRSRVSKFPWHWSRIQLNYFVDIMKSVILLSLASVLLQIGQSVCKWNHFRLDCDLTIMFHDQHARFGTLTSVRTSLRHFDWQAHIGVLTVHYINSSGEYNMKGAILGPVVICM